jgi:hypothetical protein
MVASNTCASVAVGATDPNVTSINLQAYLPNDYTDSIYRNNSGYFGNETIWFPAGGLQPYYDQVLDIEVPGQTMVKEQRYNVAGDKDPTPENSCLFEYDFWQLGNDGSVTEAGSWPSGADCAGPVGGGGGYRTLSEPFKNTGLTYSGPGALTKDGVQNFDITNSLDSASYKYGVYAISRLEAFYPAWKPEYGRDTAGAWTRGGGNTYHNVAEITLWHGTTPGQNVPTTRCTDKLSDSNALSSYYVSILGYDSYGQKFWYAPGKGVVQSQLLYFDVGAYSCQGAIFGSTPDEARNSVNAWTSYLDEPLKPVVYGVVETGRDQ